jgi:hypothetical protein
MELRRRNEPGSHFALGAPVKGVLSVLDRILASGKSESILLWPLAFEGLSVLHALAALDRVSICDEQGLLTLFFPWNRNTAGTQRTLLVDREQLVHAALTPLNRSLKNKVHPSLSYLMALHSLKHLAAGEQGNRRQKAIERDPSLMHPTLFEITPQAGIEPGDIRLYDDHFLGRLRRHTWIKGDRLADATDPRKTPFFLIGVHADAISSELLLKSGLRPDGKGRRPDIVILDLTRRPRNSLDVSWRSTVSKFLSAIKEIFGQDSPPLLAVTDEVFTLQTLRWKILNEYDVFRGVYLSPKLPAGSRLIFNSTPDLLGPEPSVPPSLDSFTPEVYGADLLNFVDSGLKLRRALLDAGDKDLASAVSTSLVALQNLIALPGPPQKFQKFLSENYHGYELQNAGSRFDHLTPRGKINTALKLGSAGTNHPHLSGFLIAYDKILSVAATQHPGTRVFDGYLSKLAKQSVKCLVVFSTELVRAFAEWRLESDTALASIRSGLAEHVVFADEREAIEELEGAFTTQNPFEQIIFIEPYPDHMLRVLAHPALPPKAVTLCHLARAKQTLQKIDALLDLDGVSPVEWNLLLAQEAFRKALSGHVIEIPDLDTILMPSRIGTIDLTGSHSAGAGPTRIIRTAEGIQIRAFDASELALYDPDALQVFSRRLAKDLVPGDQVCVFTPDFIDTARQKLHLSATAPEILTLYHKAVAEAAASLRGYDLTAKAETLRNLIMKIDPSPSLPGLQSVRQWIDVAELPNTPRDEVRPQAPRDRRHFLAFMKALGIAEDVALHYWDWGVFWTRSMRIRSGSAFHQLFMGVLIDPHGAISRLPEAHHQEVWRIYETAEEHLVTVTSNNSEGTRNESH